MATYKISGTSNQSGTVRIFQGETYRGYKDISPGAYEVIFTSMSEDDVTATLEASDGEALSYGNVTAISGVFSPDITLYPSEVFTSDDTWTKPEGVEQVMVILAGGGGGGGNGGGSIGGSGGGGGACITQVVDVRSTTSEVVTIGAGGANNVDGTASTFGAIITAGGGLKGTSNSTAGASGGIGGGSSRSGHYTASKASPGAYGTFGADGAGAGTTKGSGGGGSYGDGGAGGDAGGSGVAAAANTGGGGGAGGNSSNIGAAGGSGICIVIPLIQNITLP